MQALPEYMQRCFDLALAGWPMVAPNPMVGCVIVCNGQVVAEGYHQKFGGPHAEVNAVKNLPAGVLPQACTVYVNLEPCSHFGKTPPCADLIIESGFKKVVIANRDPNPLVAGNGIEKLKAAGIEVISGFCEQEGRELNKRFFTFHSKERPYYILKWAQTADGFISRLPVPQNRSENLIGDSEQQREVHRMRAEVMGIMVGKNTVLCDDPSLTVRLVEGKNPLRIFIDRKLEVPGHFNIYNAEAPTLCFNEARHERDGHIEWVKIDFSGDVLDQISHDLYRRQIQSVMVEGGARLLSAFIKAGLYDEKSVFVNEGLRFGQGLRAPEP